MEFKDYLTQKRKDKKLTIEQLSKLSGIGVPSICFYGTGRHIPYPNEIRKLAKALEVDYDEMYSIAEQSRK